MVEPASGQSCFMRLTDIIIAHIFMLESEKDDNGLYYE